MKEFFQKLKDFFTREFSEDTFQNTCASEDTAYERRSRAYRRHFEGYATYVKTDAKEKKHTYRTYTGILYTPTLKKQQQITFKLLYSFIWALCFMCLLFCAMQMLPVNSQWFSALAQAFSAGCLLWVLWGQFNYLIAHEQRTVGEWKTSTQSLKKSLPTAATAFVLNALINLGYLLFVATDHLWKELICVAVYLAGAALLLIWNKIERAIKYVETPCG